MAVLKKNIVEFSTIKGENELIELLLCFKWWDKSIEEINDLIPLLTCSDLGKVKEEIRNNCQGIMK